MIGRRWILNVVLAQHDGILGFFHKLGYRVLLMSANRRTSRSHHATHTGHELENRALGISEQADHLLQALQHRIIVSHGSSHPPGQVVP